MGNLIEDRRSQLISRGRSAQREKDGKTRYQKRVKSRISKSTREFNQLDMNKLFKQGILDINIPVHGETDDYVVSISFGGFLDDLERQLKTNRDVLDLRIIIRALINSFNGDNVYLRCGCSDFRFRQSYWMSRDDVILGQKETIPSRITNPNNTLGPGCKHIMLVLSNHNWIIKVASVIMNYIKYIEVHKPSLYADIIYPAIYGKKYEGPVQTSFLDDDNKLADKESSKSELDQSNIEARKRGQFTAGNEYRFRPSTTSPGQLIIPEEDSEDVQ